MPLDLTVMTRNLYLGADLQPIIRAALTDRSLVPKAATGIVAQLRDSDAPGRLDCVAAEIAAHRPHVVGLQEAFVLRHRKPSSLVVAPFKEERATDVLLDYAHLLVERLAARGLSYTIVVTALGNDSQAPAGNPPDLEDVRLTDSETILVSGELAGQGFEIAGSGAHVFEGRGAYGPYPDIRAWAYLDLLAHGQPLRIVATHLQPLLTATSAALQVVQADELIAAHAGRRDPIVVVGDFNSRADGSTTPTRRRFAEAGFTDAWDAVGSGPGFTCKAEEVRDAERAFDERIDYVMLRGDIRPLAAAVTGTDPANRTAAGLWPSDHGGIVSTLRLGA